MVLSITDDDFIDDVIGDVIDDVVWSRNRLYILLTERPLMLVGLQKIEIEQGLTCH